MEMFQQTGLDALICIGGDGTLAISYEFYKKGIPLVGVPKTIDNDIYGTTSCFGFDTAVSFATDAIDRLHTTAEAHRRIMVVEVMGRNAGWIALEAGMAGGADVILIPEIPYRIEEVSRAVVQRARRGSRFSIVVVAEGAGLERGGQVYQKEQGSVHSAVPRLGGICNYLAEDIAEACGAETRATVLGHLQRGGSPSPFDRVLGTRFGAAAAHLVARGGFGRMVALRGLDIMDVPIEEAIARQKLVDPSGELVQAARS